MVSNLHAGVVADVVVIKDLLVEENGEEPTNLKPPGEAAEESSDLLGGINLNEAEEHKLVRVLAKNYRNKFT